MQRGTPAKEAVDATNNHPHIVRFLDAAGDVLPTHFIAIEQELVLECRSLNSALFIMLATHYAFNIEYHPKIKDVLYFLQEKVLGYPDLKMKKSSIYMNVSSAIDLYKRMI